MSIIYVKKVSNISLKDISKQAWELLNQILKKDYFDPSLYVLKHNSYGKPYFENAPFCFNISHYQNYIAIAISKKEIGIDILEIKENNQLLKLNKYLKLNQPTPKQILSIFSKNEAKFKKVGTGIILSQLDQNVDDVFQTIIDEQYFLSVACDDQIKIVHI